MRNKKLETCIVCDGSTCRSGKGDDSLYCPVCKEGPYCDACYYDHCLECYEKDSKNKDATITRLEAEKAQKQLVIDDCKQNLKEQDAAIAALRGEAALYQKEWAILREEVERLKKELQILYSSNADMFARAEQAEKELAIAKEAMDRTCSCDFDKDGKCLQECSYHEAISKELAECKFNLDAIIVAG